MTHVLQTGGFHCRAGVLPAPAPCAHFTLPAPQAHAAAELHSCRARGGAALRSRRCVAGRDRKPETIRKSCESPSLTSSLESMQLTTIEQAVIIRNPLLPPLLFALSSTAHHATALLAGSARGEQSGDVLCRLSWHRLERSLTTIWRSLAVEWADTALRCMQ